MTTINATDLFLVNRGGVDYKITAQELKEYFNPTPLPWEGHVGGIWHVNNISATMNLQKGPPFEATVVQAYDANTLADLGMIGQINAGQDVVLLTDDNPSSLFAKNLGEWDFGKYTDISQVKTLQQVFFGCTNFNGKLGGNWDTSNVINLYGLYGTFMHAAAFNQDISGWDTSNVPDMMNTFSRAKAFNQPLGNWNTSKVTTMAAMFDGAEAFNQDISGWDTSNVEEMASMFLNAHAFNQDIGSWNTSKLTDMYDMFKLTSVFNQDIGRWDTSNVTSMTRVFEGAKAFNQDLSNWCVTTFPDQPNDFDKDADAWTEPRPCWGHCPPKGDPCPVPPLPPLELEMTRGQAPAIGATMRCEIISGMSKEHTPIHVEWVRSKGGQEEVVYEFDTIDNGYTSYSHDTTLEDVGWLFTCRITNSRGEVYETSCDEEVGIAELRLTFSDERKQDYSGCDTRYWTYGYRKNAPGFTGNTQGTWVDNVWWEITRPDTSEVWNLDANDSIDLFHSDSKTQYPCVTSTSTPTFDFKAGDLVTLKCLWRQNGINFEGESAVIHTYKFANDHPPT